MAANEESPPPYDLLADGLPSYSDVLPVPVKVLAPPDGAWWAVLNDADQRPPRPLLGDGGGGGGGGEAPYTWEGTSVALGAQLLPGMVPAHTRVTFEMHRNGAWVANAFTVRSDSPNRVSTLELYAPADGPATGSARTGRARWPSKALRATAKCVSPTHETDVRDPARGVCGVCVLASIIPRVMSDERKRNARVAVRLRAIQDRWDANRWGMGPQ
jgi:hypothetical protein